MRRRTALGLSRAEVATRAGLSPERVEDFESRPVALTGGELLRVATALDTTIAALTGGPADRPPGSGSAADRATLEPMRREECVALLKKGGIGRIAFTAADGLVMVPVNFCYVGDQIIFRTAADSTLAQYDLAPVAFEIDAVDDALRGGWSVLVTGMVRPATGQESLAARGLVEPWAGGDRAVHVVIDPEQITGRRIVTF
ncbi:hypothetical protein FB561_5853 [Kribbella amoyensis]|uniref:HTH cro/C1-type domain-containing protein n=2 Tax=Kribbella amoyensis TaxID=996641 RepID=A0A561C0E2_9ACTN|nr:hypothetical protein FB561_5853 [Kribbella amoyensis]